MATIPIMRKRETAFTKPITAPAKKMEDAVLEITHPDYDCLYPTWSMLEDCYMGGGAITNAGDDVYLIKRLRENDDHYAIRKKRSKYYNKCKQVVSTLHGHLWRKQPVRTLPAALEDLLPDVDRQGTNANFFFRNITKWSMALGPMYVLVEYPKVAKQKRLRTADEEKQMNLRPYFTSVSPNNLLNWHFTNYNGKKILDWIVICEQAEIEHEPFFSRKTKTQYKLYARDRIEIWQYKDAPRGSKKKMPELVDEPYENTLGIVPLVPFYYDYVRFGVAMSAIYDTSMLNIELYNKHSDKDTCEYYAGFPVHVFRGINDAGKEMIVGEDHGVRFNHPDSDFRIEEFKGTSIEALRRTEADIIVEIYDIAMKQVRDLSYQRQTAESKHLDRVDAGSDLKMRALSYMEAEKKCWQYAGMWMPTKIQERDLEGIEIEYNTDYIVEQIKADMIKALLDLNSMEKISDETLWEILKREELFSTDFDPEEERRRILTESNSRATPDFSIIRGGLAEGEE